MMKLTIFQLNVVGSVIDDGYQAYDFGIPHINVKNSIQLFYPDVVIAKTVLLVFIVPNGSVRADATTVYPFAIVI